MDMSQKITELNPYHKPFVELDYFQWLKDTRKSNIHAIETKTEYLSNRFDFVRGVDSIDRRTMNTLKYTEQFYFDFYVLKDGVS